MSPTDYEFLCRFVLERSGLSLGPGKEYLIEARLVPVAQSTGLDGIPELVRALRAGRDEHLAVAVTEAMTTNETLFFRDTVPFEELRQVLLPALIQARQTSRRLRIWCAAASTGQEPYSVAMTVHDGFPELQGWQVDIVGTDISVDVLSKAKDGIYTQFEVQRGLPIQMLLKHFEQHEDQWQIKEPIRKAIHFRQLNLLDSLSMLGEFDIVFCRNVLIYFDEETKKDVLDRIRRQMRSDGYLFLGAAETVLGITTTFERFRDCKAGVYRPAEQACAGLVGA